jgi:SNF2 family DNA or RNA helicase
VYLISILLLNTNANLLLLLIVLPDLIFQWCYEIRKFVADFEPMVYYGDKRISVSNTITKVVGTLSRNHAAFAPGDKTHRRIIVTSLSTLQARHGPSELKKHRIQNGWSSIAAADAYHVQDKDWHSDLSGLFDTIAIDEAHCIKNDTTASQSDG